MTTSQAVTTAPTAPTSYDFTTGFWWKGMSRRKLACLLRKRSGCSRREAKADADRLLRFSN